MQISIDTSAYNDQMHVCFNLQQEVNARTYAVCSSKSSKEVKNKYITFDTLQFFFGLAYGVSQLTKFGKTTGDERIKVMEGRYIIVQPNNSLSVCLEAIFTVE